jgi:glycine cleavage system H protein
MSIHKYASSHEWVKVDDKGIATIGISDYAQDALGDIVFVDLPAVGSAVTAGKETAVVESVKSVSDIYSPVSGEVVAVNDMLANAPETINASAESDGWLFRVKISNASELDSLLDPAEYASSH